MLTDNPLFFIPVSVGFIFIILGFYMLLFPPRKINSLYGYRTTSSMKNQDRWDFAQNYASKEMIKLGFILALSGLLGLIFEPQANLATIMGLAFMIIMIIILIIRVEKALTKKFEEH